MTIRHCSRIFLLFSLALLASPVFALESYMKVGDIKGASINAHHNEQIRLVSWAWNTSGGDRRAFRVVKVIDQASPLLAQALLEKTTRTIEIFDHTDPDVDVRTIKLEEARITNISVTVSAGGVTTETLDLNAERVTITYPRINPVTGEIIAGGCVFTADYEAGTATTSDGC